MILIYIDCNIEQNSLRVTIQSGYRAVEAVQQPGQKEPPSEIGFSFKKNTLIISAKNRMLIKSITIFVRQVIGTH